MRRTLFLLIVLAGFAQAQDRDRGAIKLDKPYKWEMKSMPYIQPGGLFKAQSSSFIWSGIGPDPMQSSYYANVSGRVTCLAVDPTNSSVVYAGAADGGLWKTTDGGSSWTPLTDNFPRLSSGAVAVDPNNPQVVYYGTGELNFSIDSYPGTGIFKSTDGGSSWTQMSLPGYGIYYTGKIVVAPSNSNVVYACGFYDLYKTTDAGNTWSELNLAHGAVDDIVVDPQNPDLIYVSYGSVWYGDSSSYGIHESTDGGATWSWLKNGLPPANQMGRISLAIAPSNDQVLYAAIHGTNPTNSAVDTDRVYTSTNGGASWSPLPSVSSKTDFGGTQGYYNNVIAVDPTNPAIVYVGGIDFWRSSDGGNTWTNLTNGYGTPNGKNIHVDQHAIAFANGSGSTFYIGNDGGVWKTTDGSTSFTNCNSTFQTIQFYDIAVSPQDPSFTFGGTQDNGIESNTQPSSTWNEIYVGDGGYCLVDPTNSNIIYSEYVNGALLKSTNGGSNFGQITSGINGQGYWLTPFVMDPTSDNVLYTATSKIYKSTNGGSSWTALTGDLKSSSDLFSTMSISPVEGNVIYAGISGYRGADSCFLFVSTDSGTSWNNITANLPTGTNFCRITADPTHKGTAYLAVLVGLTNHVLRTTDYGQTWVGLDSTLNGFADVPTKIIAVDSTTGYIYAGTYAGVYRSTDNGAYWAQFGTGLPNSVVDGLAIQYSSDVLRVGTHGRGAWQVNLVTGIASQATPPSEFALNQNYPNPFNPSTVISYKLSALSHVTLKVYDVLGREVKTLVNERQNEGTHLAVFDAKGLPSGVYFYRIEFGGTSITRKMVLLK